MNSSIKGTPMDPLLHPSDVAKILRLSLSWLAKARLTGTGPKFVKLGRSVRYPQSTVRAYIVKRTRNSTSQEDNEEGDPDE